MWRVLGFSLSAALLVTLVTSSGLAQEECQVQSVTFTSGRLRLVGFLLKPGGDGPFPAVVWNHGWGPPVGRSWPFADVRVGGRCMSIVDTERWTYLLVVRRGYGESEGEPIQDYAPAISASREGRGSRQRVCSEGMAGG